MTWAPHPQARRISPAEEAAAYARLLTQLEEAADRERVRVQRADAEEMWSHGITSTAPLGHLHSEPLSAEEARLRSAAAAVRREASRRRVELSGGADTAVLAGAGLYAAILVGFAAMTVASYYLVRGIAPKKSANAYGGAAAASNLIFPLIGPIVVGIMAANADGKR